MIARQSYPSCIISDIDECSNGSHMCDVKAPVRKATLEMENVAKVHVVTFMTIF